MYQITEEQLDMLNYILEHLTVTGPIQGGLLSNAAGTLAVVRGQKTENKEENKKEDRKPCQ